MYSRKIVTSLVIFSFLLTLFVIPFFISKHFKLWVLAQTGSSQGMYKYGYYLRMKKSYDYHEAIEGSQWIEKAAKAGNIDAMTLLATKYEYQTEKQNESIFWYKKQEKLEIFIPSMN